MFDIVLGEESQLDHFPFHQSVSGLVDLVDTMSRTVEFGDFFHHPQHCIVALFLTFGELAVDGDGTAEVGGIVLVFASDVKEN